MSIFWAVKIGLKTVNINTIEPSEGELSNTQRKMRTTKVSFVKNWARLDLSLFLECANRKEVHRNL